MQSFHVLEEHHADDGEGIFIKIKKKIDDFFIGKYF
jgi:hypothetical protein